MSPRHPRSSLSLRPVSRLESRRTRSSWSVPCFITWGRHSPFALQALAVLGVAWLRIGTAAAVFAAWRRPLRVFAQSSRGQRQTLIALGVVLGLMNACFYLAISRLPLSTVGTIEFLGPLTLAAVGIRSRRTARRSCLR